ncbi:MAG: autotransporter-associated beta strand repeat-containing protein, partial [Luteolibacter sp.]
MKNQTPWSHRLLRCCFAALLPLLIVATLRAAPSDPWTRGTGLFSNTTLGVLKDPSVNVDDVTHRPWPDLIDYDVNPGTWTYDIYVPSNYDASKPYGVVVYITSDNNTAGFVLQTASNDKNLIWIAPRNVGNAASYTVRFGASLLALYRAKELFNIDARRVYTSGKSGGARVASALAFLHPEIIKGTAPSAGVCVPRLSAVSPDYLTKPTLSNTPESFYDYSNLYFSVYDSEKAAILATARTQKLRSYIMGRENDYREEYFVEAFHCGFEPQGQACFLYNAPGEHTDPNDAEMEEAIDYLDRDDLFPVNANITAGVGGFAGMTNISQSGASAVEATAAGKTTYTLAPALSAVAAAKTNAACYWDNAKGSTVRWLWEVKNAAPTNQKTSFGLWFANETWGGGAPTSVTAGSNPGILITITQNGSQNRIVISARPDSGGETVFYDGTFSFSSAYSTAWTNPQTGYLSGTGSPVEMRMDLNQKRWQLTFNGIVLGTQNSIASGTHVSRDNKRSIFGYWDSAVSGTTFWKHDPFTSRSNTWSPITKSIFTAATGALSGTGTAPSPMELRYVIASDPNLPDPPLAGPTGLAATTSNNVINLTWNAVNGATSYTLQRSSVSGGPYTTLQSGITGTSYTDSTVTLGNIYYYTIFATLASGNTATVAEVGGGAGFKLDTWSGGGADTNWQTAANWTTLPVAGDSLVFAGTVRLSNTNNFPANTSFRDLMFSSGAGAFTLAGNAIALTVDVANYSANTQTVNVPVALAAGAHNITTNTGNLALGGVISGSGSVSKAGSGTVTLSGANTYSGGTTIDAGTLTIGSGTAVGNLGAAGSTITQNAGTLTFAQTTSATHVAFASNLVLNGGTINATTDGRYTLGSGTAGAAGTNTIAVNGSTTFA